MKLLLAKLAFGSVTITVAAFVAHAQESVAPVAQGTLKRQAPLKLGLQQADSEGHSGTALIGSPGLSPDYIMGPGDQFSLFETDLDEISNRPFRVDLEGNIDLPLLGQIHVAGISVRQLKKELNARLMNSVKAPDVIISMLEFRSQPVTVLGSVNTPGVYQAQGHLKLFEILSLAGGLRTDAGSVIKITRDKQWGALPLPDAHEDSAGHFSEASISTKALLSSADPSQNIQIMPDDVISIPKAEVVYAVGSVMKPGGYLLGQNATLSALQVLALSEGIQPSAALKKARILRVQAGSASRIEIPVNIKKVEAGLMPDLPLQADDILYIPSSGAKVASARAISALVTLGTGMVIYGKGL